MTTPMATFYAAFYDSHAHLVADDQARYPRNVMPPNPLSPKRLPGTIGRPGGHHGADPIHETPDVARMLRWMREMNVIGAAAVQKKLIYRFDNSYILDACDLYPDVLTPVVILDAEDDATPGLLRNWTRDNGLASVRLFGYRQPDGTTPWLNSERAFRTWDAARDLGLVVDLEIICQGGGALAIPIVLDLVKRYPQVPIVLDHLLEPLITEPNFGFDDRHAQLARQTSVFYKFTSINLDILRESNIDAPAFLRRAVDLFGADKIMWGSDIGTSSGTYKDMVERMISASSRLTEAEREAVWSNTARRVFVRGGKRDAARR
jgi:L-fuconolactonase